MPSVQRSPHKFEGTSATHDHFQAPMLAPPAPPPTQPALLDVQEADAQAASVSDGGGSVGVLLVVGIAAGCGVAVIVGFGIACARRGGFRPKAGTVVRIEKRPASPKSPGTRTAGGADAVSHVAGGATEMVTPEAVSVASEERKTGDEEYL